MAGEQIEETMDEEKIEQRTKKHRLRLPAKMIDKSQISIWSILKQFIGKELSKIAMPAALCEPLTFLQRLTENVHYAHLLNRAADPSNDPVRRLEYISAFAVASISSNIGRLAKPFNPLLGETYECIREDLGFRFITEQVSHHYGNMEIVCHKTGYKSVLNFRPYSWSNKELNKVDGYIYDNNFYSCDPDSYEAYVKTGKKLPMTQFDKNYNAISSPFNHSTSASENYNRMTANASDTNLKSLNGGERQNNHNHHHPKFTLSDEKLISDDDANNNTSISDLERLEIADRTTGLTRQTGGSGGGKQANAVAPVPIQRHSVSMPSQLHTLIKDLNELWIISPRPPYASDYYNFTYFAITLNELKEGMEKTIAPTDSRYRTDVRQLELGDLDGASREKNRLEEKQRESRRNRKEEFKGTWFYTNKHPVTNEDVWLFNNKYWIRDYSKCPDLY